MKTSNEQMYNMLPVLTTGENEEIAPIPPRKTKDAQLKKSEFYNINENFNR